MTGISDGGCWAAEGNVCSRLYPRIHAYLHNTVSPGTPAEGADCIELMMMLLLQKCTNCQGHTRLEKMVTQRKYTKDAEYISYPGLFTHRLPHVQGKENLLSMA